MSNWLLYVALRATAGLLPLVPLSVAYRLAEGVGAVAYYVVRRAREGVSANLAVALRRPAGSREVRSLVRKVFANDAKNWIDTVRIARTDSSEVERNVRVEGWEVLETAAREGKGIIMVTMHVGNFDLVGQVLVARGYRLTVPVERMKPERLFRFLAEERGSHGVRVVPTDRAPREMLRTLREGGIVGLAGDRGPARGSVAVSFFGRPVLMPRAAAALARRTGAPLLLGVGARTDRGYLGLIRGPISLVHTEDAEADEQVNVQTIATALEEFVLRFPEQWLAFRPIWVDGARHPRADSMSRRTEAGV